MRQFVLARDHFRCQSCGKTHLEASLQIDPILPVAKGGSHDLSHLQTLCKDCNRHKWDRMDPRYRQHYRSL